MRKPSAFLFGIWAALLTVAVLRSEETEREPLTAHRPFNPHGITLAVVEPRTANALGHKLGCRALFDIAPPLKDGEDFFGQLSISIDRDGWIPQPGGTLSLPVDLQYFICDKYGQTCGTVERVPWLCDWTWDGLVGIVVHCRGAQGSSIEYRAVPLEWAKKPLRIERVLIDGKTVFGKEPRR